MKINRYKFNRSFNKEFIYIGVSQLRNIFLYHMHRDGKQILPANRKQEILWLSIVNKVRSEILSSDIENSLRWYL